MKTLTIALALMLSTASAFACPNHDSDAAPKTAEKKDAPKKEEAPKADAKQDQKADASKKDAKDTTKKPDKVSSN